MVTETVVSPVWRSNAANLGLACRAGSSDSCDPDETCTGVADAACPVDFIEPVTTVCNAGSGDLCDPDETCTGLAGDSCPADGFEPGSTVCRAGSGDSCDPDELCTGVADAACPADFFEPVTTVCDAVFFRNGSSLLSVSSGEDLSRFGKPEVVFRGRRVYPAGRYFPNYDVFPDGEHFVFVDPVEEIDPALKEEVLGSKVLIGLISVASIRSVYVLFELGARWGANLDIAPLLAPGVGTDLLKGPLGGIKARSRQGP